MKHTKNQIIRTGSLLLFAAGPAVCSLRLGHFFTGAMACACSASASSVICLAPGPGCKPMFNYVWMLVQSCLIITGLAVGIPPDAVAHISLVCTAANFAAGLKEKYADVRGLFKCEGVRRDMNDYSRLFWFAMLCIAYCCICSASPRQWLQWARAALLAALYVLLYYRAYTGRTMVTGIETEDRVYDVICGKTRYKVEPQDSETMRRKALYRKAVVFMEESKPYLDPDFDMEELSRRLYTNRTYLSKTINLMSETNFRTFLNNYRINYAADLIRRDPHLKVKEVASMSGYNNPVTFSLVFRETMGRTPSEYSQELMAANLSRRPSMTGEQER